MARSADFAGTFGGDAVAPKANIAAMAPEVSSSTLSGYSRMLTSLKKQVGWFPDRMLPQPEARAV
jgi:hypothetical protein